MKIYLILLCLSFSFVSLAQNYTKKELLKMTVDKLFPMTPEGRIHFRFADMREIYAEWNKIFDQQNLRRDRNQHRIDWKERFPIKENKNHLIKGTRIYYGLVPKKYRYEIHEDAKTNTLTAFVKMHFYPSKTYLRKMKKFEAQKSPRQSDFPPVDELLQKVKDNVQRSEDIWNLKAPEGIKFKFEMVDSALDAHYSIKIVSTIGALYDSFIMKPAPTDILAHEIGHMMGLDDEYSFVTDKLEVHHHLNYLLKKDLPDEYNTWKDMRCVIDSIMCLRETVLDYHINHIFGRLQLP